MSLLHPGKERDPVYGGWVPKGWVAERQKYADQALEDVRSGRHRGTCIDCGLPTAIHPMPDRLWRSGPDLCAAAQQKDRP